MKSRNALQLFSVFKYPLAKPLQKAFKPTLPATPGRYNVQQLSTKNLSAVIGLNENPHPINQDWVIMYPLGAMATKQGFLRLQLEATHRETLAYLEKDFYQIHSQLQLTKRQLKQADAAAKPHLKFSIAMLGSQRKQLKTRMQEGVSLGLFRLKPEELNLCAEVVDSKKQETVAYLIHKDAIAPNPKELFLDREDKITRRRS